jgi:ABC-type lipoprotein export system ATPase subunit
MDLIDDFRRDRQMTVLLATHDPAVALRAERVIGLTDGRVITDLYVEPDDTPELMLAKVSRSSGP